MRRFTSRFSNVSSRAAFLHVTSPRFLTSSKQQQQDEEEDLELEEELRSLNVPRQPPPPPTVPPPFAALRQVNNETVEQPRAEAAGSATPLPRRQMQRRSQQHTTVQKMESVHKNDRPTVDVLYKKLFKSDAFLDAFADRKPEAVSQDTMEQRIDVIGSLEIAQRLMKRKLDELQRVTSIGAAVPLHFDMRASESRTRVDGHSSDQAENGETGFADVKYVTSLDVVLKDIDGNKLFYYPDTRATSEQVEEEGHRKWFLHEINPAVRGILSGNLVGLIFRDQPHFQRISEKKRAVFREIGRQFPRSDRSSATNYSAEMCRGQSGSSHTDRCLLAAKQHVIEALEKSTRLVSLFGTDYQKVTSENVQMEEMLQFVQRPTMLHKILPAAFERDTPSADLSKVAAKNLQTPSAVLWITSLETVRKHFETLRFFYYADPKATESDKETRVDDEGRPMTRWYNYKIDKTIYRILCGSCCGLVVHFDSLAILRDLVRHEVERAFPVEAKMSITQRDSHLHMDIRGGRCGGSDTDNILITGKPHVIEALSKCVEFQDKLGSDVQKVTSENVNVEEMLQFMQLPAHLSEFLPADGPPPTPQELDGAGSAASSSTTKSWLTQEVDAMKRYVASHGGLENCIFRAVVVRPIAKLHQNLPIPVEIAICGDSKNKNGEQNPFHVVLDPGVLWPSAALPKFMKDETKCNELEREGRFIQSALISDAERGKTRGTALRSATMQFSHCCGIPIGPHNFTERNYVQVYERMTDFTRQKNQCHTTILINCDNGDVDAMGLYALAAAAMTQQRVLRAREQRLKGFRVAEAAEGDDAYVQAGELLDTLSEDTVIEEVPPVFDIAVLRAFVGASHMTCGGYDRNRFVEVLRRPSNQCWYHQKLTAVVKEVLPNVALYEPRCALSSAVALQREIDEALSRQEELSSRE